MGFIEDFLEYSSGTECHPNFLRWSALMPIAIAAGRRYHLMQGRLMRLPELCICLIGPSGGKKTFAKDLALDIVSDAIDIPIAADITSRDDLMRWMASKDTVRFYENHEGAECEHHPVAIFIDEIRHFMSYSPSAMISFLVAIYGRKVFHGSTIKRGAEDIIEPCLNLLGCTTQDWIVENLKSGILAGGWSRRFIVVYEPDLTAVCVPRPSAHPQEKELRERMRKKLHDIQSKAGVFTWAEGAEDYFDAWYIENKKGLPEDPHIQAYYLTKDQQLLKVCMLIALSDDVPKYEITRDLLGRGILLFRTIEENLPRLYLNAGRNELIVPQQKLLEALRFAGGGMTKKDVLKKTEADMSPMEQISIIRYLNDSGQIYSKTVEMPDGTKREMLLLPNKAREVEANGGKWLVKKD